MSRYLLRVVRRPGFPAEVTLNDRPVRYVRGSFGYPDPDVTEVLFDTDEQDDDTGEQP